MIQSQSTRVRLSAAEWAAFVILLLVTWGLRLCLLEEIPPGWRDDELINIHVISGQPLSGEFPLYFTDASGHEPLYHYLHAGIHKVLGFNVLSGHLLSVVLGTLSVVLTYALCRRLFGTAVAVVASWSLTTSFWSLMYSRTAIRHISLPPFILAIVWLMPIFGENQEGSTASSEKPGRRLGRWTAVGILIGASFYTYPAARVIPGLLAAIAIYLAIFHRRLFLQHWCGMALALLIAGMLWVPLGAAIARGSNDAAAEGIGADARLAELAVPVRELLNGNPEPLLKNIWNTLGMFHITGDPEWLYNIPGRPVFNHLGGVLVWSGILFCALRWREPRYLTLLVWFGLGLLPTFASIPPASLSHSILVQPLAMILPALALYNITIQVLQTRRSIKTWAQPLSCALLTIFLLTNGYRDLRDYFTVWPARGMVRFLYRADYRDAASYLNTHQEITDAAVASNLMGPWDRLAVNVDVQRDDVSIRLFDPERALLLPNSNTSQTLIIIPYSLNVDDLVGTTLAKNTVPLREDGLPFRLFVPAGTATPWSFAPPNPEFKPQDFANGLTLADYAIQETIERTIPIFTLWEVPETLDLPPIPVVANPPPPGVYNGPRLAVFAHLLTSDGELIAVDDGLWVDPLTLQPGDQFIQVHRLILPEDAPPGPYSVAIGLYDPMTGSRWSVQDVAGKGVFADQYMIHVEENP